MRAIQLSLIAALTACPAPAFSAERVTKVEAVLAWTLYADGKSAHEFCFITAEAKPSAAGDAAASLPRVYLTAWPKEGVKAELSFLVGPSVKTGSGPSAQSGQTQVQLISRDDRLYVSSATDETKLIEAMKRGTDLSVKATPGGQAKFAATFSLGGFGQALAKLRNLCG